MYNTFKKWYKFNDNKKNEKYKISHSHPFWVKDIYLSTQVELTGPKIQVAEDYLSHQGKHT